MPFSMKYLVPYCLTGPNLLQEASGTIFEYTTIRKKLSFYVDRIMSAPVPKYLQFHNKVRQQDTCPVSISTVANYHILHPLEDIWLSFSTSFVLQLVQGSYKASSQQQRSARTARYQNQHEVPNPGKNTSHKTRQKVKNVHL